MATNAFTLHALLDLNDKKFKEGLASAEKNTKGFGDKLSKLGSGIAKVGKIAGAAVAAASTAIGKIVLDSVKVYSNYEQLVGGVETLFGTGGQSLEEYQKKIGITEKSTQKQIEQSIDKYNSLQKAQDLVMKNAHKAFQTAGVDANTYMETVTGFSASLLQSVSGDTLKAAKIADMAMTDMSDNANKMGTDMSAIQSAYAGFAKQNYTMLDNLKLGYGGTASEMKRLLKDAEEIQKKNGVNVKYSINNLSDVYEAIHVVQEEMGVAGTTAKEASTTIQGSTNMMKAAWTNLQIAITDPNGNIGQALTDLTESVKTAAKNWLPAIKQALQGIGTVVKELAPIIGAELPGLIKDLLPSVLSAGIELVKGLVQGILTSLPTLLTGLGDLLTSLLELEWPSWDDVKGAAIKAWDSIKAGAKKLAGLVFGTKENGEVDWPTWEDVKAAALAAWGWIKSKALDLAGLVFGRKSDGTVDWPTWEDVQKAATAAWDLIKSNALGLAGLIFGKKENGEVAWPTWDDVKEKARLAWQLIKNAAKGVAGLIFGKKENGEVAWPTWDDVKEAARIAWETIKGKAKDVAGLIFGKKENGEVDWPDWDDVRIAATNAWDAIKSKARDLAGLIFGKKENGTVDWPDWNDVGRAAGNAWKAITDKARTLTGLILGTKSNGQVDWPDWVDVATAAYNAWQDIKKKAEAAFEAIKVGISLLPSALDNVLSELSRIPREIEVKVRTVQESFTSGVLDSVMGNGWGDLVGGIMNLGSRAKGAWDVPYDGIAQLHRNEMVLTASQARQYREGGSNGEIDYNALSASIVSAIREGMNGAEVHSHIDGKEITDIVNRNLGKEMLTRRFA